MGEVISKSGGAGRVDERLERTENPAERDAAMNRRIRYSRRVLCYGAGFLASTILVLVTSMGGMILGTPELGVVSMILLVAAGILASLWMDAAQRERQRMGRQTH